MTDNMARLYDERLRRYTTAMRNEQPDMVPIRPFVAEFTAKYAGFDCQQVAHDYNFAFEAARKCAADFDWDAVVPNMVYVWTGLTQALGLKYYGVPGIDVPADTGFQYREPSEGAEFMREDEYDALIDDPTGFLYNIWLPRVSADIAGIGDVGPHGDASTYRNNIALVKGSMAMLNYFNAFGPQCQQLRDECGCVSAIGGILKAPFDIIADKLRGYIGLTMDMANQPEKVLAACEALAPHLAHVALSTADPNHEVPVGFWMHRGCVPFVTEKQFESHFWPTLRPIIEELWKNGHQTLFYAEGDWNYHLDRFRELPERSIVFHVDRGDIFEAHAKIGDRFCLSGGVGNVMLAYGSPDDVRARCRAIIDGVAREGGYIMDASAIVQNDAKIENIRAMTDATREFGVYSSSAYSGDDMRIMPPEGTQFGDDFGMVGFPSTRVAPGACLTWEEKSEELAAIRGDADLAQRVWEDVDALGNMFIWQCLLSF